MKKITIAILIMATMLTSAANASLKHSLKKEIKVALKPEMLYLVESNGVINVQFEVNVPKDFMNNRVQYVMTPYLIGNNNLKKLPPLIIMGKKYMKYIERTGRYEPSLLNESFIVPWVKEGQTIAYSANVMYEEWMNSGEMIVDQRFITKSKNVEIDKIVYAKGIKVTTTPPAPPKPVKIIEKETITKEQGTIKLNFNINSSKINLNLDNNRYELACLQSIIHKIESNKNNKIKHIRLTASSSPDGLLKENTKLTQARAHSVKEFLMQTKDFTVPMEDIHVEYIDENWDMLKTLLKMANETNKPEVMKIFDISDPNKRSMAMRHLPQFNFIKNHILPQLRYVTYEICYKNM